MKLNRPQSYARYNNKNFEKNFSKTSAGFYKINKQINNNRNFRIFSSNSYAMKYRPKLFSLLDVNDKITNSRGTSLPMQYKRLTEEETQRQFGFSFRQDQNYKLKLIKNFLNNIHTSKYKNNNKINNKNEINQNNVKKLKIKIDNSNKDNIIINKSNEKTNKTENKKEAEINNTNNHKKKIVSLKTKQQQKTESEKKKIIIKNRNDYWLPKGYEKYELLVNNPKLLIKQIKSDPFAGKLPDYTFKVIKQKSYESDIFFNNPPTRKEGFYNKILTHNNHNASDVFNQKFETENLLKTSEIYLFKTKPTDYYYLTRESNSKWSPKLSIPTFVNAPSISYNILNPGIKYYGLTKEDIKTEIENKKRKNLEEIKFDKKISESVNYMNPLFRQKGLGEFIDITRNGGNNTGKDYIDCFKKNPKCFTKNNETCSTFYNSYLFYKDICNKPFVLDPSLKMK